MADAGAELLQGNAYAQAQQDAWRKNAAMNALTQIYGPIAGDPEDAQKDQNYLAATQQDPLKTQQLGLQNQGLGLENQGTAIKNRVAGSQADAQAAYRAAQVLISKANPDGSIPADAYDTIVAPNAAMLGLDPAHVGPLKQILTAPGGAKQLATIAQSLLGPQKMLGAAQYGTDPTTGQTVEILHTASGQTVMRPLADGAVPTAVANAQSGAVRAQTGQARVPIAQQQANNATAAVGLRANQTEYGLPTGVALPQQAGAPGVAAPQSASPAPAPSNAPQAAQLDAYIKAHGGIDGAIAAAPPKLAAALLNHVEQQQGIRNPDGSIAAPNTPAATGSGAAPALPTVTPKRSDERIAEARQFANNQTTLGNVNTLANNTLRMINSWTAGPGAYLKDLNGSQASALNANLESLGGAALLGGINALKNDKGSTGTGGLRIKAEIDAIKNAYGSLQQGQPATQLAYHIQLLQSALNTFNATNRAAFKAKYQTDPEAVLGGKPPQAASAGAAPQGKTYTYNPKTGQLQ